MRSSFSALINFFLLTNVLFCLVFATGCSVVKITKGNNEIEIKRHFGLVSIELSPTTDTIFLESVSLGAIKTPYGFALGYHNEDLLALKPTCKLVIWVSTNEQLEFIKEIIGDQKDICVSMSNNKEVKHE